MEILYWAMIHVMIIDYDPYAYHWGIYNSMDECFVAREQFIEDKRPIFDYQVVCIPVTQ